MTTEAAIKFLEELSKYFRIKARDSQEDREIQAHTQNADNCLIISKMIK